MKYLNVAIAMILFVCCTKQLLDDSQKISAHSNSNDVLNPMTPVSFKPATVISIENYIKTPLFHLEGITDLHELDDLVITTQELTTIAPKLGFATGQQVYDFFYNMTYYIQNLWNDSIKVKSYIGSPEDWWNNDSIPFGGGGAPSGSGPTGGISNETARMQCQNEAIEQFVMDVFGIGLVSDLAKKKLSEMSLSTIGRLAVIALEIRALLRYINSMNRCSQQYGGRTIGCEITVTFEEWASWQLWYKPDFSPIQKPINLWFTK